MKPKPLAIAADKNLESFRMLMRCSETLQVVEAVLLWREPCEMVSWRADDFGLNLNQKFSRQAVRFG